MTHYLHAQFHSNGKLVGENRWFFVEPKHLQLPASKVSASVQKIENGKAHLSICSDMLAKNVRLEVEGEDVLFDDNYFDLDPGEPRSISLTSRQAASELERAIRICWLNQGAR